MSYLTPAEKRVVTCLADGLTADEVGAKCGISSETVRRHSRNARIRLRARNTSNLIAMSLRGRLIP